MKKFLTKLAKDTGKILLTGYHSEKKVTSKGNLGIVTDIDHRSEEFIVKEIKKNYPDHSILAEEGSNKKGESDWLWIIDPIDGTTNFSQKHPIFCVSIALAYKDELKYGAVYAPILDELFYAEKGRGSYLNGKKISVSKKNKLRDCVFATGFAYDRGKIMKKNMINIKHFLENRETHGIRIDGSAALNLSYVAAGRYDGFWEFNLSPWDMAAGVLLVQEAGGDVTKINNQPWTIFDRQVVASNKIMHKKMLERISYK